ncbi:tetratricopeptide repeat protein [Psittacicella gerlachiana]|uniref:LapB rubredoxin metal binding domain-containing protein n=1 Tax=Psittacicella gerlachiana TaxID=2028574 RepID=A0A3A1YCR9_9GAMM|nr:tetratricopeptide repeat protein [Psittacicella gerlachiana]RIY35465.1 hypothetical protein CKF59_03645 [Psittacicella gerlachiana]
MSELLFLIMPLIALISFFLGYIFKGSFSTWLLKRRTKQSYLDAMPLVIKDDNPQANEVVEKLLTTVEYIVDGNLIANTPSLQKNNVNKVAKVSKKAKENFEQQIKDLEQSLAQKPEVNVLVDDFYSQISQVHLQSKTKTWSQESAMQEQQGKLEALEQTLSTSSLNNPAVSALEQALAKGSKKSKGQTEEQEPFAARSLEDLFHPYSVLADDVGHLLEMQMMAGVICMQRGDYSRAIKIFRHILAIPSWKNEGHSLAQINLSRCYLKAGMYSSCLQNLLPLIGNDKYEHEVLDLLLQVYLLLQDWQSALAVAKEIYALRKNNSNLEQLCHFYLFRLLSTYLTLGHRRTMFSFQRIIELAPTCTRAYVTRANYHFALGDYHSALEDYEQAIKLRFELLPALINNLAYCYANIRSFGGKSLETFLQGLEVPEKWQYMLDLYHDQIVSNFNFLPYVHNFEFQDKARNSAEVFRELVMGQKTLEARDYEAELTQKAKLYQKKMSTGGFIENIVSLVKETKTQTEPEIYERLESLLESYQRNPQSIILERIFALVTELLTQMPAEEQETEKHHLLAAMFSFKRKKAEEGKQVEVTLTDKQIKFAEFLTRLQTQDLEARIKATYACSSCGYQHHDLFWLCPSCHKLETFTLHRLTFTKT